MALRRIFFLLAFLIAMPAFAQVPEVPSVIYFADMTLKLNEQARREIQADVNALYRNPSYFQIKLDRVNLYMPIVERVLREQGVPDDLKYLVIQESSLISDAVSTSNAIGFWQFKKGTAEEVFMRVDNQIDERKSIVSSTKGAALYLKKHQSHLNNWATALVSYQMGLGGARGYFGDQYKGKRTMDIDRNSHWYLKKFLAHKIAFENQIGKLVSNGDFLHEHVVKGPTTLTEVARTLGVSEAHLRDYNKWSLNGHIPGDKTYVVTYIQKGVVPARPAIQTDLPPADNTTKQLAHRENSPAFPRVSGNTANATQPGQVTVNGIEAVKASASGSTAQLASQVDMRERRIRRLNDLSKSDPIQAGQFYYTKRKKGKAVVPEHIVQPGETLWQISQRYGIRLHSLKAKNRIYKDEDLKPGMVILLQAYRKRGEEIPVVSPTRQSAPVQQASTRTQNSSSTPSERTTAGSTPAHSSPPPSSTVPDTPKLQQKLEHVVEPGDTLYAISRKHNVTVDELRNWNQIGMDNTLKVGQKIIILK